MFFHLKSHENDHWKFNGFNTEVGPNLDPKCLIMDDLFLQPVNNFSVMSGWVFCVEPVPISLRLKCLVPLLISCWHWSCPSLAIIRQANQFVQQNLFLIYHIQKSWAVIHLQFVLMGPGTRCFQYQWVLTANLWVLNTIFNDKSAILLHPGTRWNKNLCAKDAGCAGNKITAWVRDSILE